MPSECAYFNMKISRQAPHHGAGRDGKGKHLRRAHQGPGRSGGQWPHSRRAWMDGEMPRGA